MLIDLINSFWSTHSLNLLKFIRKFTKFWKKTSALVHPLCYLLPATNLFEYKICDTIELHNTIFKRGEERWKPLVINFINKDLFNKRFY